LEKAAYHGNRKKKGLTLVETIIALSIISLVSLATVSIIVYSSNALRNTSIKAFFNHEVNSFSSIYIAYHEDGGAYSKAMKQYTGADVTLGEDHTFYYDGSFNVCEAPARMYSLLLDFEPNQLIITASNNQGGTILSREVRL